MLIFTTQEQILLCIYDAGSRAGTPALFPDGGVVLVPDELGSQHLIDHPGAAGKIGFRAAAHKAHGGQHCLAHLLVSFFLLYGQFFLYLWDWHLILYVRQGMMTEQKH